MAIWIEPLRSGYLLAREVTIGDFPAIRTCEVHKSLGEVLQEAARAMGRDPAEAYFPHHAEIALIDGFPVGTGNATHVTDDPAPDLTPAQQTLADLQAEDPPLNGPDSPGEAAPDGVA